MNDSLAIAACGVFANQEGVSLLPISAGAGASMNGRAAGWFILPGPASRFGMRCRLDNSGFRRLNGVFADRIAFWLALRPM